MQTFNKKTSSEPQGEKKSVYKEITNMNMEDEKEKERAIEQIT
jgi:hypothetical protein